MSSPQHRAPAITDLMDGNAKTLFEHLKMNCKWKTCLTVSKMKYMPNNEVACFMRCAVPNSSSD